MKNVMIATPAHNGLVNIPYTLSFATTLALLHQHNILLTPLIVRSGSLLVAERNRIIQAFWESECTHLLCIDADLGWPAEAVVSMLEQDKEFIGGCYPARNPNNQDISFLFRPELTEDKHFIQDKHLLKMQYIPAGFMLLSRSAIQKMRDKHEHLHYIPRSNLENNPPEGYCFFNTEVYDGEFWGEDFVFCRLAREAEIDIWVDPLIQFDHAGTIGMFAEYLHENAEK